MEFLKSNIYAWGIYDGHMTSARWADDGPIEFSDIPEYMFDCDVVEMWFSEFNKGYYVDLKNYKSDLRNLNITLINGE